MKKNNKRNKKSSNFQSINTKITIDAVRKNIFQYSVFVVGWFVVLFVVVVPLWLSKPMKFGSYICVSVCVRLYVRERARLRE